ncbi:MAG: hypothetical protein ABS81_10880 [Pseudonocardia sp. SCN 72-86]|nr:MAG: hypothetical protein ABS81_10880 [Pseudonocardia sp. SCN 72-86]
MSTADSATVATATVDFDRHVGIARHEELFPAMPAGWDRHFEREEFVASIGLTSNHIRVTDTFRQEAAESYSPPAAPETPALLLPYQALTVNGWSDRFAARAFVEAINAHGVAHWASGNGRLALAVSPHDAAWSAAQIRRYADRVAAVAVPLVPEMLGSSWWSPIYEACVDTGLPVLVHFSGVEGHYLGAPPLSGGVHASAFARMALMPHVAESNIASLAFESTFLNYPELQFLFAGFGFTWLPALLWRLDREWRTFRHDVPWITAPPSERVLQNMWFTTWPVGEAADIATWDVPFSDALRSRIVFGSHTPHDGDSVGDLAAVLGPEWAARVARNGATLLGDRA